MADNEQDGTLRKRKRKRQGKTMPTNSDVQDESPPPKKSYQSLNEGHDDTEVDKYSQLFDPSQMLHGAIKLYDFASHRAQELTSLAACIEGSGSGNKRAFQTLPHYMRRRTMSNDLKRIPRRIQELHKREIEKVGKKLTKKPSRKHRRRPSQLLQEYNRRQRNFIWLETHIWHAKRFVVMPKWGYKLPMHSSEKSKRACYRGAREAALLQDVSYFCCLELSGRKEILLDGLSKMTDSNCGLTFASKMYTNGGHEGSVILYRSGCYPNEAIAKVSFIWKAQLEDDDHGNDCLWIWVHPSAFEKLKHELIENFRLERQTPPSDSTTNDYEKQNNDNKLQLLKKKKELAKLSPRLEQFYERMPVYCGHLVILTILKDTLVRFRLLGNTSTAILARVLKVKELHKMDDNESLKTSPWWSELKLSFKNVHTQQSKLWTELTKCPFASRIPPSGVIGLTVCDPREDLPVCRNKVLPKVSVSDDNTHPLRLSSVTSFSHIWDRKIREEVTFTKMTDFEMNKMRSEHLVPGTSLNVKNGSCIPILLIQQSAGNEVNTEGIGIGWDIILPVGWAMAFWIPIVYQCARVGGYRESQMVACEKKELHFPEDFPDTEAGKEFEIMQNDELKEKYFRYPPDKRPNFVKLGVISPFSFPWKNLVTEWTNYICQSKPLDPAISSIIKKEYFVLRNRSILQKLKLIQSFMELPKNRERRINSTEKNESINWKEIFLSDYFMSLVPVSLRMTSHGKCPQFAMICKPFDSELQRTELKSRTLGPCEPRHADTLRQARLDFTNGKKKLNKSIQSNELLESEIHRKLLGNEEQEFENLYLPTSKTILNSCSRPIMGYVKKGGFSLSEARVTGFGFVSYASLVSFLKESYDKNQKPVVLIRAPHSCQYYFADFSVMS